MGWKSEKTKKKKKKEKFKSYVTTTMAIRILKRGKRVQFGILKSGQKESTLAQRTSPDG